MKKEKKETQKYTIEFYRHLCFFVVVFLATLIVGVIMKDSLQYTPTIYVLSSYENQDIAKQLKKKFAEQHIDVHFDYASDLEIIDTLNHDLYIYNAVWLSNSTWLYQLDNSSVVSDSKSISVTPVVMGIRLSKAQELGFTDRKITNNDILEAIRSKKLNYVMSSAVKTNSGATSYLGFLNVLAGNPEVLTLEHLKDPTVIQDMKDFFTGVNRVSGDEDYLEELFLKDPNQDAIIASETTLIRMNQSLEAEEKEPLYLVYPTDGVAINDSPLLYIPENGDEYMRELFLKMQQYLLSEEGQQFLQQYGRRTWYGGTSNQVDQTIFNPDWGIHTEDYLIPLNYPSKEVMDAAFVLYVEELRKPTFTVFCLDFSGSMYGRGNEELQDAMRYILNYEEASKELIQFSTHDAIMVIPFADRVFSPYVTWNGRSTYTLTSYLSSLEPIGGTNLYGAIEEALARLEKVSDEYMKMIIVMTDGQANIGTFQSLERYYRQLSSDVPIYSITFGDADRNQLLEIADLSNGKVFDGTSNLLAAFKEVRSYN